MKYFKRKRITIALVFILLFVSMTLASTALEIEWQAILLNSYKSFIRFTQAYLPVDFSKFSDQLYQLWVTLVISIAGAFVGMLLAFFSSLMISVKTSRLTILKYIVRGFASFTRNIPDAVWAVILIPCLWFGEFLGFIVMCIISYGFLTRTFADAIDETNSDCMEALEATGASYWQIIIHAVIPETLPALISWSLFAIENNIRSATVVGMLAGGGIGYLIGIYKGYLDYQLMSSAIILVVITVILTDQLSTQIRKRLL